jgi:multimeric flavodoxin WrbA
MKILAVNGGPRKTWNTATLLAKACEGAASKGAQTELVHLYDLDYKGCTSCFSCKLKGGKSYGRCAMRDGLTPVLDKIAHVNALLLGSPIYLGAATGMMRSFLERLTFPCLVYDSERSSLFKGKLPVGFIYTMGAPQSRVQEAGYERQFQLTDMILARIFGGPAESLVATDTLQFDDYSKYVATAFDVDAKEKRRREVFPEDCRKAFEMGARLVE